MLLPQIELKAQSVCNFLDAPLIANRVAGGRNHRRLPAISLIFSNPYRNLADASSDDHVGQLLSAFKFLRAMGYPLPKSRGPDFNSALAF